MVCIDICLHVCLYTTCTCMYACLCTTCMPDAQEGQKKALGPLELKLQATMSCHVGAGN